MAKSIGLGSDGSSSNKLLFETFDDFAAIKLVVEGSGAVENLTMLEAIDFTKATSKASKIGYKAPGQ